MTKPVRTLCESGETHNTAMTKTGQKKNVAVMLTDNKTIKQTVTCFDINN